VDKFTAHLGERANVPLDRLTERDVLTFRDGIAAELSQTTANNLLKMLRVILNAARLDGLMQHDPAARVKVLRKVQAGEGSRRGFTLDELRKVLEVAGESEWRSLVVFGLYAGGQRLGDLAQLRWSHVDVAAGEIRYTTSKTGRRVLVPVCAPLRDFILSLPASDDPAAPVHPRAAQMTVPHLSREFGELLAQAGLRKDHGHQKRKDRTSRRREQNALSFHSLRHTATSLMKNAGVSAAIVQDIIGHESAEVSLAYTHIERGAKLAALETLPDVLGIVKPQRAAGRKKGK
jgi:integrase